MEPKFQSSFIPKTPIVPTAPGAQKFRRAGDRSFLSFIAVVIFIISIVAAGGTFGYKFYLKYRISQMDTDLQQAQATLKPEIIRELTRLDARIISTKALIATHPVLSPLFEFLETSTPKTVRFTDFNYVLGKDGLELHMRGEAKGYTALAFQADIFNKNQYFKTPIFSDFELNSKGDVTFSFKTIIDPEMVSYQKDIDRMNISIPAATSTTSLN